MDVRDLMRLSEGIKLPSKNMEDMIVECQSKYQKRKILKRRMKITSICVVSFIFCVCFGAYLWQPEISVYAAAATANVKLQENEQVILAKQSTTMGVGYKLELDLPKGEYTYTVTDENSQYPQNVFQKGNEIYWMPDGVGSNLRDADGNIIKLPKTDKTVINIQVMTGGNVKETFQLCLDREDGVCTVTLKDVNFEVIADKNALESLKDEKVTIKIISALEDWEFYVKSENGKISNKTTTSFDYERIMEDITEDTITIYFTNNKTKKEYEYSIPLIFAIPVNYDDSSNVFVD